MVLWNDKSASITNYSTIFVRRRLTRGVRCPSPEDTWRYGNVIIASKRLFRYRRIFRFTMKVISNRSTDHQKISYEQALYQWKQIERHGHWKKSQLKSLNLHGFTILADSDKILRVTQAKYLDFWVSSNLSWDCHILKLGKRMYHDFHMFHGLKILSQLIYFLTYIVLCTIKIDYGLSIWGLYYCYTPFPESPLT